MRSKLAALVLAAASVPAQAVVVTDAFVVGDGKAVYDTVTGLDWLDLRGGDAEQPWAVWQAGYMGFSLASTADVTAFFADEGLGAGMGITEVGGDPIAPMLFSWGGTAFQTSGPVSFASFYVGGSAPVGSQLFGSLFADSAGTPSWQATASEGPAPYPNPFAGIALVREHTVIAAVPEPEVATLLLAGFAGIAGIAAAKRRRYLTSA
jgi:hypothetical protein